MEPRLTTVIFCDDVRSEEGSKVSLMGIYNKRYIFQRRVELPLTLPKLCIFQRWEGVKEGDTLFLLVQKDGKPLPQFEKPIDVRVGRLQFPGETAQLIIQLSPFTIETLGEYHFSMAVGQPENVIGDAVLEFISRK